MEISDAHKSIVSNLAPIHGSFRLSNERSGVVAYMACPHCLEVKGSAEFDSKHMVVLLDRWLKNTFNTVVAKCMRCEAKFKKSEIMNFPTLKERNYSDNNRNVISTYVPKPVTYKETVDGIDVPYDAGTTIPITELPRTHAVWEYLDSRNNLDIDTLIRDFHAAFCTVERPESKELGIFYKRLPESRNTAQGRLVISSYVRGHLTAWQSRVIDKKVKINGGVMHSYLHPDTFEFTNTHYVHEGSTTYVAPYEAKKHLPAKYYNGRFHKHKIVFGYDAYARRNANIPYEERTIFVAEGVLDAIQLGGTAVACLGKSIREEQVPVLLSLSPKIVFLVQNDDAAESGFTASAEIMKKFNLEVHRVSPPAEFNDFGDMHHQYVKEYVRNICYYRGIPG
jgi:hypothetical protein